VQASGCREQNWRMSDMAAVAAETASVAPTWDAGRFSSAGKSITTTLSQNAAFNKNLMTLPRVPAVLFFPHRPMLANND
jgi:hypothetical protein